MIGAVAAASLPIAGARSVAAQESAADDWIKEVKGTHRCLFDFPQHNNAMPLLHIIAIEKAQEAGIKYNRQ